MRTEGSGYEAPPLCHALLSVRPRPPRRTAPTLDATAISQGHQPTHAYIPHVRTALATTDITVDFGRCSTCADEL